MWTQEVLINGKPFVDEQMVMFVRCEPTTLNENKDEIDGLKELQPMKYDRPS